MNQRRSRRRKLPSEPVELSISSLSHEGRGVAHINGKVAFVDGALAEETVMASYVRNRSQFAELRTQSIVQAAADRVEPPCRFSELCGGCSLQHLQSQAQLQFKQSVLLEQLLHATGLAQDQFILLPSLKGETEHYRRKARLAVRMVFKKGGVLVGFREKYSSFITDMDDCKVLVREVANLIKPLRELISTLAGKQDIPQIEVAVGERSAAEAASGQVALVFRHLQPLLEADLEQLRQFARDWEIELYLQPAGVESVHKIFPDNGEQRLHYFLPDYDLQFQFHPMDFTQINAGINRQIIVQALELLQLNPADKVLDLFCGLGNFTLPIARHCHHVVGVEGSQEMVHRGEENAALNSITNAEFHAADLSKAIDDKSWARQSYDKIIIDPPRSGASEIIAQLARLGASKIVYVSCNPATLARDSAILLQSGYRLKSAGVMDMFPHTTHVESMAEFERIN
jgi:23S rRNA (uracil1939-C5)-methyltransferase